MMTKIFNGQHLSSLRILNLALQLDRQAYREEDLLGQFISRAALQTLSLSGQISSIILP
jgi:hypothetical protein